MQYIINLGMEQRPARGGKRVLVARGEFWYDCESTKG